MLFGMIVMKSRSRRFFGTALVDKIVNGHDNERVFCKKKRQLYPGLQ